MSEVCSIIIRTFNEERYLGEVLEAVSRQTVPADRREVVLGVRPSDLRLASSGLPAHVERIEDLGDSAIVSLSMAGQMLKLKTDRLPAAADGDNVFVGFAPEAAHLFDPKDGQRL